ncbi:Hypothetical predicted protein [Paramuricea clavata]|uniref:Uncharacterized protein n=1 Tax=Paramuricea clavata TaxID=317549 RepID=A0A6S7GG50_PARCT|nr:Hypothetical predicted protein [Paramuricea clavata]
MWILWDNSKSVGPTTFKNQVRPFLKSLINSPQLNVGPDGTHIGILTFSTQAQTRVLLKLGEIKSPVALNNYLDSLRYIDVRGDGTRTGMALKLVDEKFNVSSPRNYRPDVSDVVLILTDGQPIRRKDEDNFGDKYKSNSDGEELLAKDRAQSLRDKNVTVVGLAVGSEATLSKFGKKIKEWTTEGKYFETSKDRLHSVMKELISASCIDPGQCGCSGAITAKVFRAAQGGKAVINWEVPTLKCASGRQAVIKSTDVQPPGVSPPAAFGVGNHTVTYTYDYRRGTKVVRLQCPIKINVTACQCPGVVRVNAELAGGSKTVFVSWTIPEPNCPATLSSVSPPKAGNGNGRYPIGKYDVRYNYEHSSASGSFSLNCPVKITIEGKCGGVRFGASQVCCCGAVHERKDGYDCCGFRYYDTRIQRCEDFSYTLVNI